MSYRLYAALCACAVSALAATGSVRGVVHDPQHRPLTGAQIVLHNQNPVFSKTAQSTPAGEFQFDAVPEGSYTVDVTASGFLPATQQLSRRGRQASGAALHAGARAGRVERRSFRQPFGRADFHRAKHRDSRRNRANRRRRSVQQPVDDHQLHPRRLHGPRHAPHARRPPGELAHRWNSCRKHEHLRQRRAAHQPQRRCGSRSRARRLFERIWRPHLRLLQRRHAFRIRHEQRSRTGSLRRQLLLNRRSVPPRRPHPALRLVWQASTPTAPSSASARRSPRSSTIRPAARAPSSR